VDAEGPLVVECEGFVVRVERAESAAAVAVQFQSYQFSHRARDDAGAQEG
jgi:hypothetical protein